MKNISIFVALFAAMVFASCNKNEVVVIRLDETELELIKGETRQLKATVVPADASASIEWFSSMPEYVSVSETGLIKAEKIYYKNETDTEATPVTVYCKYNGGAAECEVMVLPLDVESISLKVMDHDMNESLRLDPLQTKTLVVEYEPADADIDYSKLEWRTSYFKYVSVKQISETATAQITANWAGSADITVTYGGNLTASVGVIVNGIEATSVTIANKEVNTVVEGNTLQLSGSFQPANATVEMGWTIVQGSECATINAVTGLLTAIQPGTVTVKVAAGKVNDFITITVLEDTTKNE
jgi:uncharacterized protein YjdB